MRKCQELATVLAAEYNEKAQNKRIPRLVLSLKDKNAEKYYAEYVAGKLRIEAESPIAQAYAVCQLGAAVQANHLADFTGERKPRFGLRPVWLKAPTAISITENLSLHLPEFMLAEDAQLLLPRLCKRVIECGYNAILVGSQLNSTELQQASTQPMPSQVNLQELFQQIQDHGIKLIVKPNLHFDSTSTPPTDPRFAFQVEFALGKLFQDLPKIDALFWESNPFTPSQQKTARDLGLTESEMVLQEIRLVEKTLKDQANLIYYIPSATLEEATRQTRWLTSLIDDIGKRTTLSFGCVAGSFFDDHQDDHPLWEALRNSPDISAKGWMPILNGGLIKQGEGLWPTTNFDLIERFISRCYRHHFAGLITLAAHFPKSGSVLDCNLWVTGHSLWHYLHPHLLAETWFKAFRPEENRKIALKTMHLARTIALEISALRTSYTCSAVPFSHEESKIRGDCLLASLKQLQGLWAKHTPSGSAATPSPTSTSSADHPSIKDHFGFFAHDVKQLLGAFLPTYNIPYTHQFDSEEVTSAFWNHELEVPCRGHKNSVMEAIFLENRHW